MESNRQSISGLPRNFGSSRRRSGRDRVDQSGVDADFLTHRVTIETPSEAQNEFGSPVKSWQTFAVVWAGIEQVSGGERVQASQLHAMATHLITIRYLAGVTEQMRLRLPSGNIVGIANAENPGQRNVAWLLTCIEDNKRG